MYLERNNMSDLTLQVEQDIWKWFQEYVEANHEFYDYKFPPCPYAKAARLRGSVDVVAYESGNIKQFIRTNVQNLINKTDKKITQRALIFPPRIRHTIGLKKFLHKLNVEIVPQNLYIQFGQALETKSIYPGFFNSGCYFMILINVLSEVLDGHKALIHTDYYKPWSKEHYDIVVTRRQEMYEKYGKKEKNDSNM